MASLLPADGVLFDASNQAPPPSKDFNQFIIQRDQETKLPKSSFGGHRTLDQFGITHYSASLIASNGAALSEVIWRTWKITLRNDYRRLAPGEVKESHEDFTFDDRMQFDVGRVFDDRTLNYALELCRGNIDYLVRMPRPLLIYMVSYLELEDIAALSQTCKLMYDICNTEALWEQIYENHCDTVTDEMRSLAHEMGWKRMFFTNKLQLQVKLRRHQNKQDTPEGGVTFLTDA